MSSIRNHFDSVLPMIVVVVYHLSDSRLLCVSSPFEAFELSSRHAAGSGFPVGGARFASVGLAKSISRPEVIQMEGIVDGFRCLLKAGGTCAVPDVPVSGNSEIS